MHRITIVCTQRGRHDPEELAAEVHDGTTWRLERSDRTATVRAPTGTATVRTASAGRYLTDGGTPAPGVDHIADTKPIRQFACPACPRNLQIATETWFARLDALRDAGAASLDISRLPF